VRLIQIVAPGADCSMGTALYPCEPVSAHLDCDLGVAKVTDTLKFKGSKERACCVTFRFPLPPRSAIRECTATFDNVLIKTHVKCNAEAQMEYREAIQQGHNATIISKDEDDTLFSL